MNKPDYVETYRRLLHSLIAAHGEDRAMDLIVGGQSHAIGILEQSVLMTLGLEPSHTIVDVGCGSGRLSSRLAPSHQGVFIGTDILPELVDYAARKAGRKEWSFRVVTKPPLPLDDSVADFVCFFSVFTHLLDEDIFRYLQEATRLLRPGGKIVFSYLDFAVPSHWTIFEQTLGDTSPEPVLNKFISKDAIAAWASHLGLQVTNLYDGPVEWIRLPEEITYIDGRKASGVTGFGQSVAVLQKGT